MKNQGFVENHHDIKGGKTRGNAIVIILIMIALLGALTLALTRMGSNSNDISQEKAQVIASQVLRQAKNMAAAADGLIAKGCSVTELSFENSTVNVYTNAQTRTDNSCKFFDAAGAGLSFPQPPAKANDGSNWHFSRNYFVTGVGAERETLATGTSAACPASVPACQDLVAVLPLVDINVCKAFNILAGVNTSFATAPPQPIGLLDLAYPFNAGNATPTTSNFSQLINSARAMQTSSTPANASPLWDKKAACVEATAGYLDTSGGSQVGTGKYFIYQVLVER